MKLQVTNSSSPFLALRSLLRLALFATISVSGTHAVAQSADPKPASAPEAKTEQAAKDPKLPFTLRVTNDQIIGLSLKAQDVSIKEIAAELSKRLKIPILLTPIVEKHMVTVNFTDLVLEPAMQMLAPQVFIDYEIDTTPGKQPRPVAVYLQGYNERPPADNAAVKSASDIMVIEGDTEEGLDSKKEEDEDLKITFEKGQLSVKSKKQPLVVVLYGIANQLGIPLEVKNEVTDLVTVNINKSSVESALQELGPNIRLYLRADLMVGDRRPLRLVLVGPDKKS
jgi:type II secretory pathway component GspD/PulD (secretin)